MDSFTELLAAHESLTRLTHRRDMRPLLGILSRPYSRVPGRQARAGVMRHRPRVRAARASRLRVARAPRICV